jgi:hypothetical protein
MTLTRTLLTVTLATSCAVAQNVVVKTKAAINEATQTKNAQIEKVLPVSGANAEAKPSAKAATPSAKTAQASKSAAPADAESAASKPATAAVAGKGPHRDPFVSPIVQKVTSSVSCTGGKKCLEPGQVVLKGVISAEAGRIAVVTNPANKAYFLREQDPVLNGYVVRITTDSIVFRENVTDRLGKVSTREVIKKVSAPAV